MRHIQLIGRYEMEVVTAMPAGGQAWGSSSAVEEKDVVWKLPTVACLSRGLFAFPINKVSVVIVRLMMPNWRYLFWLRRRWGLKDMRCGWMIRKAQRWSG